MEKVSIQNVKTFFSEFIPLSSKIWIDYDKEADVLYISFRRPQDARDSEMEGDIIHHYDGDQLVGITVLNAEDLLLK